MVQGRPGHPVRVKHDALHKYIMVKIGWSKKRKPKNLNFAEIGGN